MHYPVMTERQLAARWKISLKTLRRWRSDNEGPTWHKLFQYVRYHEADILGFERQSAQHWSAILGDDERVPKVVTRPPQDQPQTQEDAGAFCVTTQDVIEATGLPKHWFTTPEYRTRKQVPHLTLVGNVRFSLQALWQWEQNHSTVGRPQEPKAPPPVTDPEPAQPSRVPRWHELARELDRPLALEGVDSMIWPNYPASS